MSYISLGEVGSICNWRLEQWLNKIAQEATVSFSTSASDLIVDFHLGSSRLSLLHSRDARTAFFLFTSKAHCLDVIIREWSSLTKGLSLPISLARDKEFPMHLEIIGGGYSMHAREELYFNLEIII